MMMEYDKVKNELDQRIGDFKFNEGVILVQIPQVASELFEVNVARSCGYFAYPPQGLLYLAAIFRELEVPVHIVDLNYVVLREIRNEKPDIEQAWQKAMDEAFSKFKSPLICISYMFLTTFPYFKRVCHYTKENKPEACIAAGGVSATSDLERILRERLVDFAFSHEGEGAIKSFVRYAKKDSEQFPFNLSFLGTDGNILHTEKRLGGEEYDIDIRKEYSQIPIDKYHEVGSLSNYSRMNGFEIPFATIISRRGCRGHCSFCGTRSFNGKGVRVRSPESVVEEMEFLYKKYNIRHFDWLDDDLLFDTNAAIKMFRMISERLPDITWGANNGLVVASISPTLLDAMKDSGCIGFKVGLESGNEEMLQKVHKPITLEKFFLFAKMSRDFPEMFVAVNIILGVPDETFGQMLDSFNVALQGQLDWYNFYMYQPIKNSELYLAGMSGNESREDINKTDDVMSVNPVRGGAFKEYEMKENLVSGYDIFDIDRKVVPSKEQLSEIWFTLNFIVNFLKLPALVTESTIRLKNAVRWMEVLSMTYPEDPSMVCLLYYLKKRVQGKENIELEELKFIATKKLNASKYWQYRDRQFNFSSFLDDIIPEVDTKIPKI